MSMQIWKDKLFTWSMFRYVLALLTLLMVTIDYFCFSHYVHQSHHFHGPEHGHSQEGGHSFAMNTTDSQSTTGHEEHRSGDHNDHHHGRGGGFDSIHMKVDGLFLYGLAVPILLLTLAALLWNPSTSTKGTTTQGLVRSARSVNRNEKNEKGDVNVWKWTIIFFIVPLFLVMLDGARGHSIFHTNSTDEAFGWNLYVRICMSLMSPSGYAATWSLALFLIPVTKHSPILDWLHVTPTQALAFHRVSGWVGFWNSVLHGYLHLRHLMDVLNRDRTRSWLQQLKFLLIPDSWQCFEFLNPWGVFFGKGLQLDQPEEAANQCWLSLVNATGMVSVLAFAALAISSLPSVRRYSYALFYRVHIPSAWIMLVMAIWHYPTCALILIPNIIYYLSFHIPVQVTQCIDGLSRRFRKDTDKPHSSSLIEANLIEGGSVELIFAATPSDRQRYESHYARLFHPAISPLSHPFSIFSRDDLKHHSMNEAQDEIPSFSTFSILLRSSGPFTENLIKLLFSNNHETTMESSSPDEAGIDDRFVDSRPPEEITAFSLPTHYMIQVDSYYAGSFGWTDHAMKSHDKILLVAGGVGIVPFLEFLPNLQQRIQLDTAAFQTSLACDGGQETLDHNGNTGTLMESNEQLGPNSIHLHWYCREIGLASYIWNNYLKYHVEEVWEKNPASQNRLQIHLHLTKRTNTAVTEEILGVVPKAGIKEKQTYCTKIHPVKDSRLKQSWKIGLLLPGTIMVICTVIHWWWYKEFIINKKYHHDNLAIRSHSIVFTLVLAVVLSIPVEKYIRYRTNSVKKQGFGLLADTVGSTPSVKATTVQKQQLLKEIDSMPSIETATPFVTHHSCLKVSGGRPPVETVILDVLQADRPGVYSCGPQSLMKNLENSIRSKRKDCAFYREDSEI